MGFLALAQARIADSKFSMNVESEQQIVKLGTSVDMGFCRAKKKVGICNWLLATPKLSQKSSTLTQTLPPFNMAVWLTNGCSLWSIWHLSQALFVTQHLYDKISQLWP